MKVINKNYTIHDLTYMIRTANEFDAKQLSDVRLQIDGETENMDRERGEAYIDESGFKQIIKSDREKNCNLFLVVEVKGRIVGFSRCEGNALKRTAHKVEFGVCVLKDYWGHAIGRNLLKESIHWVETVGITKMTLQVLETNAKAITMYKQFGFEVEGVLKKDKLLSDGNYYHTIVMGRFHKT
ncbi:GNAT family N-acetyltransferase [Aquibacillus koreensis]|uniref:GNAT family N-acetyltransferase n=1 Tax=Aquibacillus koreensis TaxID=279446 RepID=A0A9X4ALR3_9BACI|nr:GNAT family N-acetyltransferase [Aquibacillus koreensis]MCT2535477.1 GNAT family N-acetyltransferase [Aquibacillus koreensis]MDC3422710.1 GNAT family N-acetyltransferase [Aquibacillus koreensis]